MRSGSHVSIEILDEDSALAKTILKDAGMTVSLGVICKVPKNLHTANKNRYEPTTASIGPYHREKEYQHVTEELKKEYVLSLLDRSGKGDTDTLLIDIIKAMREEIYEFNCAYNNEDIIDPTISNNDPAIRKKEKKEEIITMMILDGCFILELLYKFKEYKAGSMEEGYKTKDPIFSYTWILRHLQRDLILLENQLPFLVLNKLFALTRDPNYKGSLSELVVGFLDPEIPRYKISRKDELTNKHLLDLVRNYVVGDHNSENCDQGRTISHYHFFFDFFLQLPLYLWFLSKVRGGYSPGQPTHRSAPDYDADSPQDKSADSPQDKSPQDKSADSPQDKSGNNGKYPKWELTQYCAADLKEAGVKLEKKTDAKSLLDITFDDKKGVLKIPPFFFGEGMLVYLQNLIALEQSSRGSKITSYVIFLDTLIKSQKDVKVLRSEGIISGSLMEDGKMASIINDLYSRAILDEDFYYHECCRKLNVFCKEDKQKRRVRVRQWTTEFFDQFSTPLKAISVSLGFVLTFLTLISLISAFKKRTHAPMGYSILSQVF